MNNTNRKGSKGFEANWGKQVLSGGFTQIPNDLIRGKEQLKLTPYDLIVLEYIMSVGSGFAAAKSIAESLGISINTVRKSFRSLRSKGYVRFIRAEGEANRFDLSGLVTAVAEVASNRQRATYERNKGVTILDDTPTLDVGTNKDLINTNKDIKEGEGHKIFRQMGERLKERRKVP